MEIPTTLDDLMRQAVENALSSEALAEKCKVAAVKAIDEAISSAFSYSSPFRKMIEETVKASLPIVKPDELSVFTHCVKTVVQERLVNMADAVAKRQMDEVLAAILPDATVITLKQFQDAYVDRLRNEHSRADCDCFDSDYDPEYSWKIERSKNNDGYWDLIIAPTEGAGRYDKDTMTLRFNSAGDPDFHKCWHANVGKNDELSSSLFVGALYGFDAMLFRLYSGTAKLQAKI